VADTVRGICLPQRSLTSWLVDPGRNNLPDSIRIQLFASLYGTLPIFMGGVINTLLVALVIATRHPTPLFIFWACFETLLALVRAPVLIAGRRAIARGRRGPSDLYVLLACLWGASVGFGGLICVLSGDWVAATLAFLSAAGMVGGICFRNFAAPRLVAVMIVLSLGPCAAGGILSGEPIMMVTAVQIPLYLFAMSVAAFKLNRMMLARMEVELEKDYRVRHDSLTGLVNRAGLATALDRRAAAGEGEDVAYLFLDLDGFKRVNDTLGHSAGDRLLVDVAVRLQAVAAAEDIVARIGGDEFLIVTRGDGPARARSLGEEAIRALAGTPFLFGDEGVDIGVSVGIALSAEHGTAFAGLIDAADAALYQAKARGRCQCVIATAGPRLAAERGRRTVTTGGIEDIAATG
jgi:diguanylate cyclase (GGDEF)-like protein